MRIAGFVLVGRVATWISCSLGVLRESLGDVQNAMPDGSRSAHPNSCDSDRRCSFDHSGHISSAEPIALSLVVPAVPHGPLSMQMAHSAIQLRI